jgi:hypothetical protein
VKLPFLVGSLLLLLKPCSQLGDESETNAESFCLDPQK